MEELSSLKAYARDLETSLKINKEMLETLFETNQTKAGRQVKQLAEELSGIAQNLRRAQREKEKLLKSLQTFENDREKARKQERRREDAWREKIAESSARNEELQKQITSYDSAIADLEPCLLKLATSNSEVRALVLKHKLGDPQLLSTLKECKTPDKPPLPKVPALNLTGGLKPISETYGDESEEEEKPQSAGFSLGMPASMSKTFDQSQKMVPKLDF